MNGITTAALTSQATPAPTWSASTPRTIRGVDPVTATQIRRFLVTPWLWPAQPKLDCALNTVVARASLDSWRFDGHWYTTDTVTFEELAAIVREAAGAAE